MGKIRLNLVSGSSVEKPLITAFKENEIGYVILDNELNGSMGLPIILVCKLMQDKLTKIEDQNEWQNVKESLKKIIATGDAEYISLANELMADDIYYTQLTLPVPSFDALKNSYKPGNPSTVNLEQNTVNNENTAMVEDSNPVSEMQPINNQAIDPSPIMNNPVEQNIPPITPSMEDNNNDIPFNPTMDINNNNQNVFETPIINNINPIPMDNQTIDGTINTNNNVQPNIDLNAPVVNIDPMGITNDSNVAPSANPIEPPMGTPVIPDYPTADINNVTNTDASITMPTADVTPDVTSNPTPDLTPNLTPDLTPDPTLDVNNIDNANNNIDKFKEQKEAFMTACENMFDALVQKFERELQNK